MLIIYSEKKQKTKNHKQMSKQNIFLRVNSASSFGHTGIYSYRVLLGT